MRSWFSRSPAAANEPPAATAARRPSAEEEAAGSAVRSAEAALRQLHSAAERGGEPDYPKLNAATRLVTGLAAHVGRVPSTSEMKAVWQA